MNASTWIRSIAWTSEGASSMNSRSLRTGSRYESIVLLAQFFDPTGVRQESTRTAISSPVMHGHRGNHAPVMRCGIGSTRSRREKFPAKILVEAMGLEPTNLLTASQALYQLSYAPSGEGER
jgi:hypothetical protein